MEPEAPNRGYCKTCYIDPIIEIGIQQRKYPNTVTTFGTNYFSPYKKSQSLALQTNEIPLYIVYYYVNIVGGHLEY